MKQGSISFLVTAAEFRLLESVVFLEPYLGEVLSRAKQQTGGLRLKFCYDDLDDALSALAERAEYEDHPGRREQIRDLMEKIERYRGLRKCLPVPNKKPT